MNPLLTAGTRIVVLALLFYSIAVLTEQRLRRVTRTVLLFITLGVFFDVLATSFMIAGSPNTPFTLHGVLGYSALLGMLIDAVGLWRHRLTQGEDAPVARGLHLYSRFAYLWWVIAFITGSAMVLLR